MSEICARASSQMLRRFLGRACPTQQRLTSGEQGHLRWRCAHFSRRHVRWGLSLTSQLLGQSLGRGHRLLLGPGTLGSGASSVGTGRLSRQHRPTHTHCCCFAQQHTRALAGRRRPRATRRRSERRLQGKALMNVHRPHSAIPYTLRTICMITRTMASALALQSTRAILHPIRRSIMTRAALLSQG